MKVSARGKYALMAMMYLAEKNGDGPQSLRSVAQDLLPEQYTEQLLGSLRKAGLVSTTRGVLGGYNLSRPPAEISVGQILDATEGPVNLSSCATDEPSCPHTGKCRTQKVWEYLTDRINGLLYGLSLQDILDSKEME